MVMKKSVLTLLLVLQACNWCRAKQKNETLHNSSHDVSHESMELLPDLMCAENTCRISPDNVWDMQNIIRSNQIIIFERRILSSGPTFASNIGLIQVENVSNVLIIGQNASSHIQCSNTYQFGFYFRNVTNVTISGLKFSNCGVPIPSDLDFELTDSRDLPCDKVECNKPSGNESVTIFIQNSKNVTLSNVDIVQSPGLALVALNTDRQTQQHDMVMEHSTIANSHNGALVMHRVTALLKMTTIINSTRGIVSTGARIEISDGVISQCKISQLESGILRVSGGLRVAQSSIHVRRETVSINRGSVLFSRDKESISLPALMATGDSTIDIENSSKVVFTGFNLTSNESALLIIDTAFLMQSNSSLEFVGNFARNQSSVFCALRSAVSMVENASLKVHHNTANDARIVLSAFGSSWITAHDVVISFTGNVASDNGCVADFYASDVAIYQNTTLLLQNNTVLRGSKVFGVNNAIAAFYEDSRFIVGNNSAIDKSGILEIDGDIEFQDNVQAEIVNNSVSGESLVISLRPFTPTGTELSYYSQLIEEQNGDEDTQDNTHLTPPNDLPFEELPHDIFSDTDYSLYPYVGDEVIGSGTQTNLLPPPDGSSSNLNDFILILPTLGAANGSHTTLTEMLGCSPDTRIPMKEKDSPEPLSITPSLGLPPILDAMSIPIATTGVSIAPSILEINGAKSIVSFHNNTISDQSIGLLCMRCDITIQQSGSFLLANNTSGRSSYVLLLALSSINVQERGRLQMSHNEVSRDSSVFLSLQTVWRSDTDTVTSIEGNTASNGFALLLFNTVAELNGTVLVKNNNLSDFGVINAINSQVHFHGRLESSGNRAESGVISADNSDVFFTNESTFSDNTASNGGAINLVSSVMYVSPHAVINFIRNHALSLGGAIHIANPRTTFLCDLFISTATACSIQVTDTSPDDECELFTLTFTQNSAGIAGNAVYGGHTSACIPSNKNTYCSDCPFPNITQTFQYRGNGDATDLSNFTSDPTRVCFCENGTLDCYKMTHNITVHPGESFHLSLAIVGYGLGTVPGSVVARTDARRVRDSERGSFSNNLQYSQDIGTQCQEITYSIISEQNRETVILAVDTQSFGRSFEEVEAIVNFQQSRNIRNISPILRSPYDSIYETFFHIPIFVNVNLSECPVGFQLVNGRCICHQILRDNNINLCFIEDGTPFIHRPTPYWIGIPEDSAMAITIHPECPFDYCKSGDLNFTVGNPDAQCRHHRSGVLCGGCSTGRSMVLGSSACKTCSNSFISLLFVFAVAGMVLVTFLTLLNMTVSVGTINGLIFFANIIQGNRATFLPPVSSDTSVLVSILSAFIAWLNLDWGISTCFFDGLSTYVKTWLQFAFPLYILAIVGITIIASYYSTYVTRLFGSNSVQVLATLVLLSYAKILQIIITAFSYTTITSTEDHHSVVWLADGNIMYFESKHAVLFLTAFLVLVVGISYTVTLTAAPWIQGSKYHRISATYNKFKPLFDAYMGPYKDSCRYWTGMLLLARVILIVLFSSIANTNTVGGPVLNLLLLTLSSATLLTLTAAIKPYTTRLNNLIEVFYLSILFVFSAANLYASNSEAGNHDVIYIVLVGISFIAFACTAVGHTWYRIKTVRYGHGSQLPSKSSSHTSSDRDLEKGEEEAQVTMSTRSTDTTFIRERPDSMFRESVLDLTYTT